MYNKFSESALKVIEIAKFEMLELKHAYLGTEHLMLGILKQENSVSGYLKQINIDYKRFKKEIVKLLGLGNNEEKLILFTPLVKEILERSIDLCENNNIGVTIENIFVSILEMGDSIAYRTLKHMHININQIYNNFVFNISKKSKNGKTLLSSIGINLNEKAINNEFDPVIGRENEIDEIMGILCRKNKSNPLLIGPAGVGKTAIVEEISRLISIGNVPNKLKNKTIYNLDMSSLVAGTKYRGEFEDKINKIIKEVENNEDIILFIDEIHTLVGAGGAEGAIDASNIFKPALARNRIKVIGATTIMEYKKFIEKDKALERRFKKIYINEPTNTTEIIYKLRPIYEKYHHVKISDNLLDILINMADKYIYNCKNPDKTIDILDELCSIVSLKKNSNMKEYDELMLTYNKALQEKKDKIMKQDFKSAYKIKKQENILLDRINRLDFILSTRTINHVTKKDIINLFRNKTNNKLNYNITKQILINKLLKKIYSQDEAINKIVQCYFEHKYSNKLTSVLLRGEKGVGKTYIVSLLASFTNSHLLTINLTEYQDSASISKLIGSSPGYIGYDENNGVFSEINDYPHSIILFEDIDKCNHSVINILQNILKNNEIKDNKGNVIRFNNTFIIFTTQNKGRKSIGFTNCKVDSKIDDNLTKELINLIDDVIILNKINKESIVEIIKKSSKCKLKQYEIDNIVKESKFDYLGAYLVENLIKKHQNNKKMTQK